MIWLIVLSASILLFISIAVYLKRCKRRYQKDDILMTKGCFFSNWRNGCRFKYNDRPGCFVMFHPDGTHTVGGSLNVYNAVRDEYIHGKAKGKVRFYFCEPDVIRSTVDVLLVEYPTIPDEEDVRQEEADVVYARSNKRHRPRKF